MPRCRRQPASRRIWSLTTRVLEPRCTVTSHMVTASGVVCQSPTTYHPTLVQSEQVLRQSFKDQRLRGRCACKHQNIRREISCGCDAQPAWQRCSFFSVVSGAEFSTKALCHFLSRSSFKSRMPECQSGDAGAIPADRTNFQKYGGRQLAQQSLQNSAGSGQHRDAVPLSLGR
jgi:hypothetical protein